MELIEIIYVLIAVAVIQAYQIWRLQRSYQEAVDLVVGLHLGNITLEEVDEDEY
jgi:hypothetical protein